MGIAMDPKEVSSRMLERGSFAFAVSDGTVCCDPRLL